MHSAEVAVLLAVGELHARGYELLRVEPGLSASGGHWRCRLHAGAQELLHSSGMPAPFGWEDATGPLADAVAERAPDLLAAARGTDPVHAAWYRELLTHVERGYLPSSYDDWYEPPPPGQWRLLPPPGVVPYVVGLVPAPPP